MVTGSSLVDRRLFAALQSPSAAVAEMAFERIYRRHGPVLLAFVAHCTANLSLAQQVAEEVFVQLWNEPESFHPSRTWAPDGTDDPALLIGAWRQLRFDERAAPAGTKRCRRTGMNVTTLMSSSFPGRTSLPL